MPGMPSGAIRCLQEPIQMVHALGKCTQEHRANPDCRSDSRINSLRQCNLVVGTVLLPLVDDGSRLVGKRGWDMKWQVRPVQPSPANRIRKQCEN